MINRSFARGLFLTLIAIFFASNAIWLPVGDLARAGPGLFPLVVSGALFVLGLVTIIKSRAEASVPSSFNSKNIAIIMLSLCGFVVVSDYINMLLGIVVLVFLSGFAASSYSWRRNVMVSVGLFLVALAFQHLLGLNLGLI